MCTWGGAVVHTGGGVERWLAQPGGYTHHQDYALIRNPTSLGTIAMRAGLPAAVLLLAGSASGLALCSARAPLQLLRPTGAADRATPATAKAGSFEGFSLDTLARSFERLTDLRVARASHILLRGFSDETAVQMEEWKAEIANDPEKFAARAQESSVCPSAGKGGDLGFFTRGKSAFARPPARTHAIRRH